MGRVILIPQARHSDMDFEDGVGSHQPPDRPSPKDLVGDDETGRVGES